MLNNEVYGYRMSNDIKQDNFDLVMDVLNNRKPWGICKRFLSSLYEISQYADAISVLVDTENHQMNQAVETVQWPILNSKYRASVSKLIESYRDELDLIDISVLTEYLVSNDAGTERYKFVAKLISEFIVDYQTFKEVLRFLKVEKNGIDVVSMVIYGTGHLSDYVYNSANVMQLFHEYCVELRDMVLSLHVL